MLKATGVENNVVAPGPSKFLTVHRRIFPHPTLKVNLFLNTIIHAGPHWLTTPHPVGRLAPETREDNTDAPIACRGGRHTTSSRLTGGIRYHKTRSTVQRTAADMARHDNKGKTSLRCLTAVTLACTALACSSRETVVVYSPHGPDVLRDYEARFEQAYPDVDVLALDMGSKDVYNRVSAERGKPVADIWWGGPSTMLMQAAEEGLLEPYRPSWAESVEPAYRDAQHRWYGTYRSPLAVMFNNRNYTKETVPQTWDDLLAPAWHGTITIRKPLPSGTMRTFIGAMILRAGDEEVGFDWLKKLHDATASYMESPQLLFDHMKRNPELISVWLMPDAVLQRTRNGYPLDFVVPPQTPVLTEGIAIIKGAPHMALAKRFYEFVTTPEALAHQAHEYAKIPTRHDVDPSTLPSWMTQLTIDPMPIDWQEFALKEPGWCARWDTEVYHSP